MTGQRLVAGLVLMSFFAAGAVAGVFFERHYAPPAGDNLTASEMHEAAMEELERELGLDEAQIEQIHAVLARHQQLVQQVWEQVRPEVQDAMREVHTEIAEVLRPEQRRLYHEWLARQHDQSPDGVGVLPH